VSLIDWILALHVLSAAALIGGLTALWAIVLATRPGSGQLPSSLTTTLVRPATAATMIGILGTVVFGVWLAIDLDAYHVWDPWIIAALVLWAVGSGIGERAGRAFARVAADGSDAADAWREGTRLHAVSSAAALLILILMIWKPGA
jgi:uncharacterized membrane protein